MSSRDFCFWLQGKLEIDAAEHGSEKTVRSLSVAQVEVIARHLALVFLHDIDPKTDKGSADLKKLLNDAHGVSSGIHPKDVLLRC